jgi:AcrR family transcriptional regulator
MSPDDPIAREFRAGPIRIRVTGGGPGPEPRRREPAEPPKERLSADRIVDVALAQMKEHGYESVSMRSIARELGTGPASLYAHVANRDELDSLVIERVSSGLEVPDPDPERWQDQLRDVMHAMLAIYQEHPGVARASLGIVPMSPRLLVTMERLTALLRAGGVPDQASAWFLDQLALYVSSVAVEQDVWRSRGGTEDHAEQHEAIHRFFADLPDDEFPVLSSMSQALASGGPEERFDFGVDLMVAGIASYAEGRVETRKPRSPSGS